MSPFYRASRIAVAGFVLTGLWFASIVTAPYLAAHLSAESILFRSTTGIYLIGSLICHQRPERSFHTGATQWPVCARCTGLYGGAPLGAALVVIGRRRLRGAYVAPAHARLALGVAAIPTVVTLAAEWLGLTSSGLMRALAGVPFSGVVAWLVLIGFSGDDTLQR